MAASVDLRPARAEDVPFLWRMLTFAASMPGSDEDVQHAQQDPTLRDYVQGFGRRGDVGMVAWRAEQPVGAAWVRLAPPGPISDAKVWTNELPELAIATTPELRGTGIGTKLLDALFAAIRGQHSAVALSVREDNPAVHLYERVGFRLARRITNRVGTTSLVMLRSV